MLNKDMFCIFLKLLNGRVAGISVYLLSESIKDKYIFMFSEEIEMRCCRCGGFQHSAVSVVLFMNESELLSEPFSEQPVN